MRVAGPPVTTRPVPLTSPLRLPTAELLTTTVVLGLKNTSENVPLTLLATTELSMVTVHALAVVLARLIPPPFCVVAVLPVIRQLVNVIAPRLVEVARKQRPPPPMPASDLLSEIVDIEIDDVPNA